MSAIHVPVTITGGTYGTANLFKTSSGNNYVLFLAAVAAIYVVLGVLYESYSQPVTILSTLPSAGLGRAARAVRDRHRVQPNRLFGYFAAHRHREEKRHHDGRFRARCGA